jgi:putative oxidoreductase
MRDIEATLERSLAADAALLPPRAALGAVMLYHGREKLAAQTRSAAAGGFESLGLRPAGFWSAAVGVAEACAGVLAAAGLFTRPAALAVLVTQAVAIAKVHAKKGFAATKGGYEFNMALMAMATQLLMAGPGRYSLHSLLTCSLRRRSAARWFRPFARGRTALRTLALLR